MWYNYYFGGLPLPSQMSAKKLARYENDMEFFVTFGSLLNLVCSIFKWTGLPDTCNPRALEASLLFRGCAGVVPYGAGVTNMGASPGGGFNVHGEYTTFWGYGWNGFNKQYQSYIKGANVDSKLLEGPGGMDAPTAETGVFIRDNYYMTPYFYALVKYTKRLVDCMRRIDTTSYNLVWPGIITTADGQVNTVKSLIQAHDDNIPVVIGRETLDQLGTQVISFGVNPQTLVALWDTYYKIFGRLMEIFGIPSDPTAGKVQRVISMEVSSNDCRTALARDGRLEMRKKACEDMNALYGWNVSVEYNEEIALDAQKQAGQIFDSMIRTPGTGEDKTE